MAQGERKPRQVPEVRKNVRREQVVIVGLVDQILNVVNLIIVVVLIILVFFVTITVFLVGITTIFTVFNQIRVNIISVIVCCRRCLLSDTTNPKNGGKIALILDRGPCHPVVVADGPS